MGSNSQIKKENVISLVDEWSAQRTISISIAYTSPVHKYLMKANYTLWNFTPFKFSLNRRGHNYSIHKHINRINSEVAKFHAPSIVYVGRFLVNRKESDHITFTQVKLSSCFFVEWNFQSFSTDIVIGGYASKVKQHYIGL